MTMAEIDRLRGEANEALEVARRCAEVGATRQPCLNCEAGLRKARNAVEAALVEWWAQGCREVTDGRDER